ncbi:unnamed protein product [Laminaria digitata]
MLRLPSRTSGHNTTSVDVRTCVRARVCLRACVRGSVHDCIDSNDIIRSIILSWARGTIYIFWYLATRERESKPLFVSPRGPNTSPILLRGALRGAQFREQLVRMIEHTRTHDSDRFLKPF